LQAIVESAPVKRRGNPYRDANGKFCKQSEAVYKVDSEGCLKKIEPRINTVHDKSNGQFASKSGGLGGIKNKGTPTVISREEFNTKFPDSKDHLYRGVKSDAGAAATRAGELGSGDFGKAQYFGTSIATAQNYMQKNSTDENGRMVRAAIDHSKKPKIAKIPRKVRNGGSSEIDKWAEDNNVDIIDEGNYQIIKNPAATIMDSHNYTLDESVVLDYKNGGYELPDEYKGVAKKLGYRTDNQAIESRASRLSQVERRIQKKPNICKQCLENNDPSKVPVHPHCDCDVITESIEAGVADTASRFMQPLSNDNMDIQVITGNEFKGQLLMDPTTAAIMDAENVRFSDIAKWLETMQPYLDRLDLAYDYVSIAVDDDTQEAVDQVQETIQSLSEDTETLTEAIHNRKLWFALAKAVAI
jgi:hypothetical protein